MSTHHISVYEAFDKLPVPVVSMAEIGSQVIDEINAIYNRKQLYDDVYYLKSCGITIKEISRKTRIKRCTLYTWLSGVYAPRNPWGMMVIRRWAEAVKKERERIEAQSVTPIVLQQG